MGDGGLGSFVARPTSGGEQTSPSPVERAKRAETRDPLALWVVPVAELGGVARHVLDVARVGLPGWRLAVLCPEGPLAERLRGLGAAVVTGPFGPDAGARASLATLRRAVRALRPEVVHAHLSYADVIAAAALADDRRTALVTTEHGIAADDLVYHGTRWRARVKAELHALRLRRADAIIAVSGATRDAMIAKWHPSRAIEVVPNGVSAPSSLDRRRGEGAVAGRASVPSVAGRASEASRDRVLSLARLAPEKRLDQLLRAFAIVRASRPDATLTIAGTGPLEGELRALATELGLDGAVELPGFVDAAQAMADTDVIAQLSVWENCSYTLLDAIARGLGVVASPVGGNPELLRAPFLADADDPGAVAARILAQLDDPALRPALPAGWPTVAEMTERTTAVYARARARRGSLAGAGPAASPRDEIVIATNNGDIGGGEVMLLSIAEAVRELGHPVRVVGMREPGALVALARERGFAVTELDAASRPAYMAALRGWARRGDYRLLWCNGLVPSAATAGLPRRIVHLHKTADGAAQRAMVRLARPGALATLVPSAFMAREFRGARVLENWTADLVRRPRKAPPSPGHPVRIGFIGRLTRLKGLDILADAVGRLAADGRDVRLSVAGEATFVELADLAPVAAALEHLGDRAERLGRVDPAAFLADIDVLVVPSIVGESFGLVVAEAMAIGVPVVVSDAGALAEVLGRGDTWVVPAGDAAALAAGIAAAIDALPARDVVDENRRRWETHASPGAGRRRVAAQLEHVGVRA